MSVSRWRFINTQDGSEIIVADANSAKVLETLLQRVSDLPWKLELEGQGLAAMPPPPDITLQTSVKVKTQTQIRNEERRSNPRFRYRFRILLISGNRIFRAY